MSRTIQKLATAAGAAVVATTVSLATPAVAGVLIYALQGTLADSGSFVGTFSYDTESPDLEPGEEFGAFLLKTWDIQVNSPSLGNFEWVGALSSDEPDAALLQFIDEDDQFVGLGFGVNEEALEMPPIQLEEVFDFGVAFGYLGSDLNSPAFPEEIGDFRRGVLFNNVEVSAAQIRQVSSVPESSSPLVLLVLGYLGTKSAILRKKA
ncbi:MAG: hypothetical protein QNJ60_21845 [Xenococcaceae cyanobacterium MO_188.B19]|nr:hypothetical protein [Xenococcaceae cyanobacterium MO_188.B19]